jgi:hypothetical protein
VSTAELHDAYVGKLNAALADDDGRRVAELTADHARETAVDDPAPAPAGRVRRLLRAVDAYTVRVFNPPAPLRGGWRTTA